jgi:DNA (cytosine-5)-methyltransferase 1
MGNHPNRGKGGPARNPKPAEIRAARERAGLSQGEAAALIFSTLRTWQDWEAGVARMHPGLWRLFRIEAQGVVPGRLQTTK